MNLQETYLKLLESQASSLSVELPGLAAYMAEQAALLANCASDQQFNYLLEASRQNVAAKAGLVAYEQAQAADQRLLGLIEGAIAIGAKALL